MHHCKTVIACIRPNHPRRLSRDVSIEHTGLRCPQYRHHMQKYPRSYRHTVELRTTSYAPLSFSSPHFAPVLRPSRRPSGGPGCSRWNGGRLRYHSIVIPNLPFAYSFTLCISLTGIIIGATQFSRSVSLGDSRPNITWTEFHTFLCCVISIHYLSSLKCLGQLVRTPE